MRNFWFVFVVLFLVSACSVKNDFPELRAEEVDRIEAEELAISSAVEISEDANIEDVTENKVIRHDEPVIKSAKIVEKEVVSSNNKKDDNLVIIASAAKKGNEDEPLKLKPVLRKSAELDRNALAPRGTVQVHGKANEVKKPINVKKSDDLRKSDGIIIVQPSSIETVIIDRTPIEAKSDEIVKEPSMTYQLETFYFNNGSSDIRQEDRKKVREIVKLAKEKRAMIYVLGYSSSRTRDMDYVSHKMANFKISLKRAETVANALISAGLKDEQVLLEALSDNRPAYLEVMPEGERLNRRVEIYIGY